MIAGYLSGEWWLLKTNAYYFRRQIHDIAVTDAKSQKTVVGRGYTTRINVTVTNKGQFTETFNVTTYANTTIIDTRTNITLEGGSSISFIFTWNTTGFVKGNYIISAVADTVPGEMDTADNTLPDGTVKVGVPGDLNGDGKCNLSDLVKVAGKFGTQEGDPEFDPNYDLNGDGKTNLSDLVKIATHFGITDP